MSVTKVREKWNATTSGADLQFINDDGNVIMEIDGANRRIEPYSVQSVDSNPIVLGTGSDVTIQWNGDYFEVAPTTGFWANTPELAYPDRSAVFEWVEDFIGNVSFAATSGSAGGWKTVGDATYDVTAAAGSLGGQIKLAPETASNNEVYHQLGEIGTETFLEYTASSGKKSWVEFRVAFTSITNAANHFIGLAEEGAGAANFIHDDGDDIADKDVIGFVIWEGDPNALLPMYQTSGSEFCDSDGTATVPVAGTFLTLGLYFDGVTTLTYYADGTAVLAQDISATGFPDGEELSPILAMKNGDGDASLQVDWIRMVVER